MSIKFNLKVLIANKELRENRRITYRDIVAEANVSSSTLTQMANQNLSQIGLVTIDKLCRYFDCLPGDLILYIPDKNSHKNDIKD